VDVFVHEYDVLRENALVVDENAFVSPIKKDRQQQVAARMFRRQLLCIIVVNIMCIWMRQSSQYQFLQVIESSVGGDGTLPGGMPPDMLKAMMGDEELVTMLRSPKMQDVMKLMMSEGQDALEEAMKNDQETYECVQKLNQIMSRMNS
jgi:hypothetical protein